MTLFRRITAWAASLLGVGAEANGVTAGVPWVSLSIGGIEAARQEIFPDQGLRETFYGTVPGAVAPSVKVALPSFVWDGDTYVGLGAEQIDPVQPLHFHLVSTGGVADGSHYLCDLTPDHVAAYYRGGPNGDDVRISFRIDGGPPSSGSLVLKRSTDQAEITLQIPVGGAPSLIMTSPNGTRYALAPPNGGGAAVWVAV